ncbi:MAG: N-acetylmuramoyl-L-alanine amidase [Oryzomonas sp.]|uniref:N-acetylmuramoyl-L-alanine amidase n=1 Tax=Oryzomonas sp. TaxID=2855186 RepID=UPI002840EBD7|nr:N-acetylmuramoyl-L-alanine amidase [Oryzomonas sp.]MDR3580735.1 N-acetylmuramoyl-L-alanine amidase [Oryzomonas sp.]
MQRLHFHGVRSVFAALVLLQVPLIVEASSITIDSGHSPKHPGTTSCSGKPEYYFNDTLSADVIKRLRRFDITVRLSRARGAEVALDARAKSSNGTDVLLSIHHDSVQPQFITNNNQHKGQCSEKASGFSIFVSALNPQYEQSLVYARRLGQALIRRGLKPTLHHSEAIPGENRKLLDKNLGIYQFNELIVLKKSPTPALLLEAAVIVNPEDESLASSSDFRISIADAIRDMMRPTQ